MGVVRAAFVLGLCCVCACSIVGAGPAYGRSNHDMAFAQVEILLEGEDSTPLQSVPFLVVGEGVLPESYGSSESYQRLSVGDKARLPIKLGSRVVVFVEGGGMVSYYESGMIGTPIEFEVVAGGGTQILIGNGWSLTLSVRARRPMGNGNDHAEPEHAPDGIQAEVIFGFTKDF